MPHLASSGRTSFPADKDVPKALYRVVGYRVCGERAVRVDILERLADLIRPALAWRPGSPAPKPPGAIEGGGFTVTVNMTSLTGSSGEDFASILRSLGYRMEKRPKPAEPTPAPAPKHRRQPTAARVDRRQSSGAKPRRAETPMSQPAEAAPAPRPRRSRALRRPRRRPRRSRARDRAAEAPRRSCRRGARRGRAAEAVPKRKPRKQSRPNPR